MPRPRQAGEIRAEIDRINDQLTDLDRGVGGGVAGAAGGSGTGVAGGRLASPRLFGLDLGPADPALTARKRYGNGPGE